MSTTKARSRSQTSALFWVLGMKTGGVDPGEDAASRLIQAAQLHEASLISSTDFEDVKASVMKELLGE